ncbi:UrcA family protein [Qipengyuania huizhouensis]|uniref:UrcA family protein n=1 Tax=Qipengyuania huizhouensis TaxID=2867245 RepID=UPI001C88AFC0|nr:UrcA family protein [Qipengyuania huizhouensis]MBX7461857.1 UrcA family protein [Qipengyuania huizhouensis]
MKKPLTLATAVLAVFATPVASRDLPTVSIKITDLDLSTEVARQKLDQRIDNAARRICQLGGFDYGVRKAEADCRLAVKQKVAPEVELAIANARAERLATNQLDIPG